MGFFDFLKKKELEEIETLKQKINDLSKYQSIIDTDSLIKEKLSQFQDQKSQKDKELADLNNCILDLQDKYQKAFETYEQIKTQIDIYQDSLEMGEYGVYDPHFDFLTSDQYKSEIVNVRNRQKTSIRNGSAVLGGDNITWNGSISKGQAMVKREKKLMLRAFNGEADSFISNVEWNNISRMIERLSKSYEAINSTYSQQGIHISSSYYSLKLNELKLAYEYKQKVHQEKEEHRAIREQMREEEKARREYEAALIKAQKEEDLYQKALDKAKKEIASAEGKKQADLQNKIAELEARIAEAGINKERAISMAQQTKRGHVYIISNVGSFGENVFKIGMTRRLDPMDRIRELGDASVPFPFDVHAIIFSEDAPSLETKLHRVFEKKRLNLVNNRKEFFQVTLDELKKVVLENDASIEFISSPEARDYRESLSLRHKDIQVEIESVKFPPNLFENLTVHDQSQITTE